MLKRLLGALLLTLCLPPCAMAQTTRTTLLTTAWTDICTAPCSVKAINGTALLIVDTTPPTSLTQSPLPWNPENGLLPNMVTGAHVYGLAQVPGVAVSSIPSIATGGGSGGSSPTTTTSGALQPPTAAAGKITQTNVSVTANTSTQLVAANANRIAVEIQCDGTAPVGIDRTGGTLTSPTAAPLVIPSGSYPLYPMPIATLTAITAYTATAQVCRVAEYLR